jgi:hypothetical protein
MTIQDNPLTYLNDDSLYGLEYSLWELELVGTLLTYVPTKAIRILQKLKILNLSGMYLNLLFVIYIINVILLLLYIHCR